MYCNEKVMFVKVIILATLKGGAGKTMTTFNIAGILSENNKILLIDVDPQCNLTNDVGIDISDRNMITIRDVLQNPINIQPKIDSIIIKNPIQELPNLDIIPSSILLFETERRLYTRSNREHILEIFLNKNKEYLQQYDYIFIDTNPSMSIINVNALFIADSILITSDVSINSVNGAELFCQLWDEQRQDLLKTDNIAAMLICNYDNRTNMGKDMIEYVHHTDFSKHIILNTIIPTTVKMKDTEINHKPINILYPKEKVTKIFHDLIIELKERSIL